MHSILTYWDCSEPANGTFIDLYRDGNIRMKGNFKNGQATDSLFSYYRSGQLSELIIHGIDGKTINYFKSGQLKSLHEHNNRHIYEFYPNGQVKKELYWRKSQLSREKEYFRNGTLKAKNNFKVMKSYDVTGDLLDKVELLKSSFVFKILSKGVYEREIPFVGYKWMSYDKNGKIKSKIYLTYYKYGIWSVPKDLETIDYIHYDKIIFYKHGNEDVKIECNFVEDNDEDVRKNFVYKKEGGEWVEEMVAEEERIYELIRKYSEG